jgi:hypothetical protein
MFNKKIHAEREEWARQNGAQYFRTAKGWTPGATPGPSFGSFPNTYERKGIERFARRYPAFNFAFEFDRRGHRVVAFEYRELISGDETRDYSYVQVSTPAVPITLIRNRLKDHNGQRYPVHPDEYATGDAAFDDKIDVSGQNPDFIRRILSPQLTHWLLNEVELPEFGISFFRSVTGVSGGDLWLRDIMPRADLVIDAISRIPRDAWPLR